jgi:transcriptional regulator with XRE-family HTH domain
MNLDTTGKRIQFLREHFGLSKPKFVEILNSSSATIYRLEGDKGSGPSENFLNALKIYFLANPDWIMTGEGDMFISPEEYIDKGIEILGNEKFSAGIINILKDPRYEKLQSFIKMEKVAEEKVDDELRTFLQQMLQLWKQGDERLKQALAQFVKVYLGVGEESGEGKD